MHTGGKDMLSELGSISGMSTTARRKRLCGCAGLFFAILLSLAPGALCRAQGASEGHGKLQIYFVDVEGGQATLFVLPNGRSLLIDTGFPGFNGRDANRIAAAAKQAGVTKLDYVLISHYHGDHVGGVTQLAAVMPIGTFLDHGPNREVSPVRGSQSTEAGYETYMKLVASGNYKHVILHAGEKLPVKGLDATVVAADGTVIDHPLPGAGAANPTCGDADKDPEGFEDPDMSENGRAVAVVIQFGRVRIIDQADLTWDRERMLMCPVNKLGHMNIFVVGNHGMVGATSPALVYGIAPQVAIMDNGSTKGATIPALDMVRNAPNKPALWQLHYAVLASDHNTDPAQIANLEAPVGTGQTQLPDKGYMLKVTVNRDGHFSIFNERTQATQEYIATK
jgi:beta-lactamase superfamily II metal-dependent hydrolase